MRSNANPARLPPDAESDSPKHLKDRTEGILPKARKSERGAARPDRTRLCTNVDEAAEMKSSTDGTRPERAKLRVEGAGPGSHTSSTKRMRPGLAIPTVDESESDLADCLKGRGGSDCVGSGAGNSDPVHPRPHANKVEPG